MAQETVGERTTNEEERVPTYTALWRHCLWSCWVSKMWQNSHLPDLYSNLPQPQTYGWNISSDGTFAIDWEAPEVQEKIHTNIQILTKGCHCKTGCKSKVCGCRKKLRYCRPGCDFTHAQICRQLQPKMMRQKMKQNQTEKARRMKLCLKQK